MVKLRLRTKFLFSLIFTTAALTGTSLLIVQSYAGKHARQDIDEQVENSLVTFHQFAQQHRVLADGTFADHFEHLIRRSFEFHDALALALHEPQSAGAYCFPCEE